MGLAKDLARAQSRIKDLETMVKTLQGHNPDSPFYWEAWDFSGDDGPGTERINLPARGRFFIELPADRHGRKLKLQVSPCKGYDGTEGVEIRGEHFLRSLNTGGSNTTYITEMDPRDVAPKD